MMYVIFVLIYVDLLRFPMNYVVSDDLYRFSVESC